MKKFNDYDSVKSYSQSRQLPRGGYVCKVMDAQEKESSVGAYIDICVDIAEGDFADFFADDYKNQSGNKEDKKWHCHYLLNEPKDDGTKEDGWTKRKFKTFTEALEDSNEGYHFDWDETKFKGKLFGGLFNIREYKKQDGTVGEYINLAQVISADKIRSGDFRVPDDKLLGGGVQFTEVQPTVKADSSDDLPF